MKQQVLLIILALIVILMIFTEPFISSSFFSYDRWPPAYLPNHYRSKQNCGYQTWGPCLWGGADHPDYTPYPYEQSCDQIARQTCADNDHVCYRNEFLQCASGPESKS